MWNLRYRSAMKMEIVQTCASLLCVLTFALARSESELVTLISPGSVSSHCHEHTTMSCNIISKHDLSIRLFVWMGPNGTTLCEVDKNEEINVTNAGVDCVFKPKQLVLTIRHTKPIHQGEYLCKLRSNVGTKHSTTKLHMQECHRRLHAHSREGNTTCRSRGVYPEAHIHWFHGSRNLTQSSVAHPSIQAEDGTYEIASTLLHSPKSTLNCSLWSPSSGKYLSSTRAHPEMKPPQFSGISGANLVGATGTTFALFAAALFLL